MIWPNPEANRKARLRLGDMSGNLAVRIAKVRVTIQIINSLFF